jgi:hypothetical protein
MHHLHPEPVKQEAQFVWLEQLDPPAGRAQLFALITQSDDAHELTLGPFAVPTKQELLVLHHPQPAFARQELHEPARVEHSA